MQLIFSKLFKPKWQHNNPAVRKAAIDKLESENSEHQAILADLAKQDTNTDVRCAAIERLNELPLLQGLLDSNNHPEVRQAAIHRCCHLLTTPNSVSCDQSQYRALLVSLKDPELLTHLVLNARDAELCTQALELIEDNRHLEQVATAATTATLRQAAAERISNPDVLESLQRSSKSKDKGVFRIARNKLKAIRDREAEEQRLCREADETCDSMEHLARTALYPLYAAKLEALLQQWEQLPLAARQHCQPAFEQALTTCQDKLTAQAKAEAEQQAQQQREQALQEERSQWLATCEAQLEQWLPLAAPETPQTTTPPLVSAESLQQQWQELAHDLPFSPAEIKRFESIYQAVAQHQTLSDKLEQQRETIATLSQAVESDADPRDLARQLRSLFKALNWPDQVTLPPSLQALQQKLQALNEVLNQNKEAQQRETKEIAKQLSDLERQLDNGEARAALQLHRQLSAQLNTEDCPASLAQRFKALHARIQELKSWQQYAVVPKKEELCERMEQLSDATIDAPQRAERVKALQQEWKVLDSQDSEHSQALWNRFKQASDAAYAPCKDYYAEQQRIRQANLEKREQLCEQLQTYIDGNFPSGDSGADHAAECPSLDWKLVEKLIRTAKQEWRGYSPVDRKPGQPVQERFNAQLRRLEAELAAEHDRNAAAKQALVAEAETLLETDDLKTATDQAKQLQAQWKEIGPSDRKQEQQLWKRFRKACNALFEQRHAEWQQKKEADQAARQEAVLLCEAVEALSSDTEHLKRQMAELSQRFDELALPGREGKKLRQRFDEAITHLEAKSQDPLLNEQAQKAWLQHREICRQAEALALHESESPTLETLQQSWSDADKVPAPFAAFFDSRFQEAALLSSAEADRYIEAAEKRLRLICIRLEIIANAASPETDQALRMEYQMNRLKEALKPLDQSQSSVQRQLEELEAEWGCSPLDNRFPELQQRFQALAEQLR